MKEKKILKMPDGVRQAETKVVHVPSKEEVAHVAREAVRPDLAAVADALGKRIAHLYGEEVKTAVILNSLAEMLIEKGVVDKAKLQERVTKNQKDMQDMYKQAVAAAAPKAGNGKQPESAGKPAGPVAQTVCESNGDAAPAQGGQRDQG